MRLNSIPFLRPARRAAVVALLVTLTGVAFAQAAPDQPTPPPATTPMPTPTPTPAAQAEDGKAMVRLAFSRADANKDGKLTPDEATVLPAVAAKFSQLDTNHDGFITEDEFTAGVRIGS